MIGTTIVVNGKEYVLQVPAPETSENVVLVRTRSAGIHVGELVSRNGTEVVLKNTTRVWRWKGANTLSELSQTGGDLEYTRISEKVPLNTLLECIEIIPCSKLAAVNLLTSRWPA
jgi:hypothetical protein